MKQPKKLTREQKECLSAHCLKADEWMLVAETEFYLKIILHLKQNHMYFHIQSKTQAP